MANLQIRLDDELKNNAQAIASEMGIDLTTAVRMFLTQMVRNKGLPFTPSLDPFYSHENQTILEESIASLSSGRVVTKTMSDLESFITKTLSDLENVRLRKL
jgi:DNA-damage-inducible protein J